MYTTEAEMTAWDARIKARNMTYLCEYCGVPHANEFSRTCKVCDTERESGELDIDIELDLRQIREEEEREQRYQDFIDALDQGDVYDE